MKKNKWFSHLHMTCHCKATGKRREVWMVQSTITLCIYGRMYGGTETNVSVKYTWHALYSHEEIWKNVNDSVNYICQATLHRPWGEVNNPVNFTWHAMGRFGGIVNSLVNCTCHPLVFSHIVMRRCARTDNDSVKYTEM